MSEKAAWREKYFGGEVPDSLPLPDIRGEAEQKIAEYRLPLGDCIANDDEIAASFALLLGVYAGTCEAAFAVKRAAGYVPVYLLWDDETRVADIVQNVHDRMAEGDEFSLSEQEAADFLGTQHEVLLYLASGGISKGESAALALKLDEGAILAAYDAAKHSEAFIRNIALCWREILLSLNPEGLVSDVHIASPEALTALDAINDTKRDYDRASTIVELFRGQAEKHPQNIAVIFEERSYTYAEVDELSDRLACLISEKGLGRGDVVAVFISRSEYMVIASLGALKAGCAYLPLDPNYPDERLAFMAKDAGAKFVIVDDALLSRLEMFGDFSEAAAKMARLTVSEIAQLPTPPEERLTALEAPRPEDLFILIYTSGTTGTPKGVRVLHRNLMAYCAWYRRFFSPDETSRVTCYNSYGFDGSLTDMYPVLTVGAAVVVIPEEKKLDIPAVAEIINKHGVCLADLPSQVGRQFAMTMDCPSLKYIVVGGEKLVAFEPVHPYIVANQYGPTETTIAVTCYNMTEYEPDIPIGTPMDNTEIYIVDSAGRRVPPGALGELWIAGEQVTGGYLNRPEKTQEVFVSNPFNDDPRYSVAYRTGDIVRCRVDGNIEFAGRRDGLVKIRGFRVELSEVESAVRDFPSVKNAAVVAFDNHAGGKFIAAFIVSDETVDFDALAHFIGEHKPPYMVPSTFTQLDSIPLNQNGKVNRRALPQPELHVAEREYIAPKDETEAELARGFAAALGADKVSADEDFFAAGGDSLGIVRLLSECQQLRLNFNLIYEGKTPAGIAALVKARDSKSMQRQERDTHILAPIQALHYEWGNEIADGYGVHCDATVHLAAETDLERLADAIEAALLAHPAIDARLCSAGADGALRWRSGDMSGIRPEIESVSRADYEELKPHLRRSMNFPETRMFQIRVFEIHEPDGSISKKLYVDFLHTIIDGESMDIFLKDVDTAYAGGALAQEKFTVLDYYDEIEDAMAGEDYEKERQWNRDFVASFTQRPGEMPGDLDAQGENETIALFEPLHVNLSTVDAFTKAHSVSDGSMLSAAFGFLQGKLNGENAAAVLTFYNGRDDARYERTLGALYRHYPLCVRWDDTMTAVDFVRAAQENIMSCRRHALYEGDPVPLIISFAYQGEDLEEEMDFCGGKARYEEVEDFEEENFNFYVHRGSDDFYAALTYNKREYSDAFVTRFLADYRNVLHALAAGTKPADIRLGTVK